VGCALGLSCCFRLDKRVGDLVANLVARGWLAAHLVRGMANRRRSFAETVLALGRRCLFALCIRHLDLLSTDADAGDDALRPIVLICVCAASLFADGGKVIFQRKAGAFDITLFAAESPVRVGRVDLSVMVQNSATKTPVLVADVRLHLIRREAASIWDVSAPARHEQATNKLLYAAMLDLNTPGHYQTEIAVQTKTESALVTGDVEVLPPEPPLLAHWPYFVALPIVALLFVLNQRLKLKRRAASRL